jgi:hypothetical protein
MLSLDKTNSILINPSSVSSQIQTTSCIFRRKNYILIIDIDNNWQTQIYSIIFQETQTQCMIELYLSKHLNGNKSAGKGSKLWNRWHTFSCWALLPNHCHKNDISFNYCHLQFWLNLSARKLWFHYVLYFLRQIKVCSHCCYNHTFVKIPLHT